MWTRSLLKTNAKAVLRQRYWQCLLICLIASFLGGLSDSTANLISIIQIPISIHSIFYGHTNIRYLTVLFVLLVSIGVLIASVFSTAFSIFIGNPLRIGTCRYMMESRYGNAPLETLFSTFRKPYGNITKVMFLRDLNIILWSLLLIIPGVYKRLEYFAVPYLLAENPYLSYQRACELSRAMTEGEKWNIFILELSFFGWILLTVFVGSFVTLGFAGSIAMIFLYPYMEATYAELYSALRAKAFATGLTDETELAGFVHY